MNIEIISILKPQKIFIGQFIIEKKWHLEFLFQYLQTLLKKNILILTRILKFSLLHVRRNFPNLQILLIQNKQ